MVRYSFILMLLASLLFCASCKKDFNTLANWEEIYASWCILDIKDTAQYVRINCLFQPSSNPEEFAQLPEEFKIDASDFMVTLEEIPEGYYSGKKIQMYPSGDYEKEPGNFPSGDSFIFKTTELLKPGYRYRLTIENMVTSYRMEAENPILGSRNLEYSFLEDRYYSAGQYQPEDIEYPGSLNPSQFEKRIRRFIYYEMGPHDTVMKYVDWRPWIDLTGLKGGHADTVVQLSDDHLKYLAENIKPDPSLKRQPVGVDNMLILSDEILTSHYDALTNDVSELNPEGITVTNFDKGAGFLASRYKYTFFAMRLNPQTLDSLVSGRFTGHLGFVISKKQKH